MEQERIELSISDFNKEIQELYKQITDYFTKKDILFVPYMATYKGDIDQYIHINTHREKYGLLIEIIQCIDPDSCDNCEHFVVISSSKENKFLNNLDEFLSRICKISDALDKIKYLIETFE